MQSPLIPTTSASPPDSGNAAALLPGDDERLTEPAGSGAGSEGHGSDASVKLCMGKLIPDNVHEEEALVVYVLQQVVLAALKGLLCKHQHIQGFAEVLLQVEEHLEA